MKRILLALILAITMASSVEAFEFFDGWKTRDKALYGLAATALTVDCLQTNYIFDSPDYKELNPAINWMVEKTGQKGVYIWFGAWIVTTYVVADLLPDNHWRTGWLAVVSTAEVITIGRNQALGIKFSF